jgi:hypothetical protein
MRLRTVVDSLVNCTASIQEMLQQARLWFEAAAPTVYDFVLSVLEAELGDCVLRLVVAGRLLQPYALQISLLVRLQPH